MDREVNIQQKILNPPSGIMMLVLLCGNKDAQPIVNSGTIY